MITDKIFFVYVIFFHNEIVVSCTRVAISSSVHDLIRPFPYLSMTDLFIRIPYSWNVFMDWMSPLNEICSITIPDSGRPVVSFYLSGNGNSGRVYPEQVMDP